MKASTEKVRKKEIEEQKLLKILNSCKYEYQPSANLKEVMSMNQSKKSSRADSNTNQRQGRVKSFTDSGHSYKRSRSSAQNGNKEAIKVRQTAMATGFVKNAWPDFADAKQRQKIEREKQKYRLQLMQQEREKLLHAIVREVKFHNSKKKKNERESSTYETSLGRSEVDKQLQSEIIQKEKELRVLKTQLEMLRRERLDGIPWSEEREGIPTSGSPMPIKQKRVHKTKSKGKIQGISTDQESTNESKKRSTNRDSKNRISPTRIADERREETNHSIALQRKLQSVAHIDKGSVEARSYRKNKTSPEISRLMELNFLRKHILETALQSEKEAVSSSSSKRKKSKKRVSPKKYPSKSPTRADRYSSSEFEQESPRQRHSDYYLRDDISDDSSASDEQHQIIKNRASDFSRQLRRTREVFDVSNSASQTLLIDDFALSQEAGFSAPRFINHSSPSTGKQDCAVQTDDENYPTVRRERYIDADSDSFSSDSFLRRNIHSIYRTAKPAEMLERELSNDEEDLLENFDEQRPVTSNQSAEKSLLTKQRSEDSLENDLRPQQQEDQGLQGLFDYRRKRDHVDPINFDRIQRQFERNRKYSEPSGEVEEPTTKKLEDVQHTSPNGAPSDSDSKISPENIKENIKVHPPKNSTASSLNVSFGWQDLEQEINRLESRVIETTKDLSAQLLNVLQVDSPPSAQEIQDHTESDEDDLSQVEGDIQRSADIAESFSDWHEATEQSDEDIL